MEKLAILNTSILTTVGTYELKDITLEQAQDLVHNNDILSAIGHQSTADRRRLRSCRRAGQQGQPQQDRQPRQPEVLGKTAHPVHRRRQRPAHQQLPVGI